MGAKQNDTFGEITDEEHALKRAAASPCLRCGMLADVDPARHTARYGQAPSYREHGGRTLAWLPGRQRWTVTAG